jgi:hypothetical protein
LVRIYGNRLETATNTTGLPAGGLPDHRILDDNLIGYAFGSETIGRNEPWKPIRLFDIRYEPLGVTLDFDFGGEVVLGSGEGETRYFQNSVTGICYDRAAQTFFLTYAKDLSQEGLREGQYADPFSKNRMGVAVFDKDGKALKHQLLPEEYAAPYSHNVLVLRPADPSALHDGRLLVQADRDDGQSACADSIKRLERSGAPLQRLCPDRLVRPVGAGLSK